MDRVRELRQDRELSQAKLAVMAGMDPATLNRIEQGKGNPNLKTLQRLAEALDVEVGDLLPKTQAPLPLDEVGGAGLGESLDNLDANSLIDLHNELIEEIERLRAADAKEVKQERIAQVRERILAVSNAISGKGRWLEPEISSERRQRQQPQKDAEDAASEAG